MTSHKKGGHIKPDVLQMREEEMTAWKVQVILQVHVPENQTGMASKPTWFQSPRVATYTIIWTCLQANHDQYKSGFRTCGCTAVQYKIQPVQYQDNYYNSVEMSEMLLGKYGTLHLDREVTKGMKEKIKYLKKGQSTYCQKGQVLVQA
jgi:hypothetical protein